MGTPSWPQLPAVIESLLSEASQYGLFQAMRLVEQVWRERGEVGGALDRWLRILPTAELGFPASDVRCCRLDDEGALELRVNVLGLYGVDAPMPHYFLEHAVRDDEAAACLRAFLDIFNHRLYALLYRAWSLAQPFAERESSSYAANVEAIGGRLAPAAGPVVPGVSCRRSRSAAGLANLILALRPGFTVQVHHCLPQWVAVAGGKVGTARLGEDSLLGDEVLVAGGRIRIELSVLDEDEARRLLPEQPQGRTLLEAVSAYLGGSRDFELRLQVRAGAAPLRCLGQDELRLGESAWVGERREHVYELRIGGEQLHSPPPGAPEAKLPVAA